MARLSDFQKQGFSFRHYIQKSFATGIVEGHSHVGGLTGENDEWCTITQSYAMGNVTGSGHSVGGLSGSNYGDITDAYASGAVDGGTEGYDVGGLVGSNDGDGNIKNTYARGVVTGSGENIGALVGYVDNGSISYSFYDSEANPLPMTGVGNDDDAPGYVYPMSSANMKLVENYTTATAANGTVDPNHPEWDFTPDTGVWKIDSANDGYPYFAWQTLNPDETKTPYERPLLYEPLPGSNPSYQGAPTTPSPVPIMEGQLLEVTIVTPQSGSEPGLIGVTVPQDLWKPGAVFSFELPDEVKNAASGGDVARTLLDGTPLPSWLRYNAETMTFTATDVPQDATGVKLLVTVNGKSWEIDVSVQKAQ